MQALFDPGFAQHLRAFSVDIQDCYYKLNAFKNFSQKKFHFQMNYPKILNWIDLYTGFYMGCMLWATCLKSLGNETIIGNPFLEKTYDRDMNVEEINFILNYFEQLKKDAKYYIGKNYEVEEYKINILETYIKFLDANEGFIHCDTTDKIKLAGELGKISKEEVEKIEEKIQDVIHTGKLDELLEFHDRI